MVVTQERSAAGTAATDTGSRPRAALARRILPDLALMAYFVFALFPVIWMVLLSLKPTDQQFTTYFLFSPTLENYATVLGFGDSAPPVPFTTYLLNSVLCSVGAVLVALAIGIPCAYAAARFHFRGRDDLLFTILSFRFAPELMVIIPLYVIYAKLGLFDTYVGLIWVLQLVALPFVVWILRSYFQDLSPELEQAAALDGYNRTRSFFKVVLPLVRPGVAASALLAFIFCWNNFVFPLILTSSQAQTVTVGALAFLGGYPPAYNATAAAVVIAALPPLLLALAIQRYLVQGLSFGAVKN